MTTDKARAEDAELGRCAVADALAGGADFAVWSGSFLSAIAHDAYSMTVARSPLIATDRSRLYRPVREYIERHNLVLADRRSFNLPAPDHSLYELSWWMSRELLRDGLLNVGPSPLAELEREMTK